MRVTRHLFLFLCLAVFLLVSHPGAVDAAKKSRKKRSRKAKPAVKKNVQQEIEVSASMEEDEGVVVSEPVAEEEAPEPPPPPAQAASAQRSAATLGEDAEKDTEKASETAPEDKPAKKKKKIPEQPLRSDHYTDCPDTSVVLQSKTVLLVPWNCVPAAVLREAWNEQSARYGEAYQVQIAEENDYFHPSRGVGLERNF
jgi:hypothetical protein